MNELAIATHSLTKQYDSLRAVDGISMSVPRGSIYGFLGRNGAGKTSTIKMLLGLARATSGSAEVLGMDVRTQKTAILARTAFVSEKKTLYPTMTAKELVRFSRGFYSTWSDATVEKYSQLLEIPMKQPFGKLSNGNQTKVWLLLALCQGADLLILDEPTTALDPVTVDLLLHALAAIGADTGCTIFFSSHQLEEVEQVAEYTGIIERGKLVMEARLDDIKSQFRVITAAGASLPKATSEQVLSVESDADFCKYVVTRDADDFAAGLKRNGATVTGVASLGLREIFLQLVRKEQPCISGNAGVTAVSTSLSF